MATPSPLGSPPLAALQRSTSWVSEKVLLLVIPNFYGPVRLRIYIYIFIFIYIYTITLYTSIIIFSFPLECSRP